MLAIKNIAYYWDDQKEIISKSFFFTFEEKLPLKYYTKRLQLIYDSKLLYNIYKVHERDKNILHYNWYNMSYF
jgi:hypothetical protein